MTDAVVCVKFSKKVIGTRGAVQPRARKSFDLLSLPLLPLRLLRVGNKNVCTMKCVPKLLSQLIAGSNRDLRVATRFGTFRDDLLARIDLWAFRLPGLRGRREDIAPNLDYELEQHTRRTGARVTFNREAREGFLAFTVAPEATWERNFRDLSGAITRMCTVAAGGRITVEIVDEEIDRLRNL